MIAIYFRVVCAAVSLLWECYIHEPWHFIMAASRRFPFQVVQLRNLLEKGLMWGDLRCKVFVSCNF